VGSPRAGLLRKDGCAPHTCRQHQDSRTVVPRIPAGDARTVVARAPTCHRHGFRVCGRTGAFHRSAMEDWDDDTIESCIAHLRSLHVVPQRSADSVDPALPLVSLARHGHAPKWLENPLLRRCVGSDPTLQDFPGA
jgi:hypothetical protein